MAITITIYPDPQANGYVTLVEARAYWANALMTNAKTSVDDEVAAAIIRATRYLDLRFSFSGYRRDKGQLRQWPRSYAYDDRGDPVEGVPQAVKDACCEYAFRSFSIDLLPDPTRDESGRAVKSKREKVGPIEEEVEYVEFGGLQLPTYPLADRMLAAAGLLQKAAGGITVGDVRRA